MKKIIAGIIAITTVLCTLTGCGKDAADEVTETSAETTAAQEETTEEIEQETTETGQKYSSYEELVKDLVEAYSANDRKKTLLMQYPDGIMDFVNVFMRSPDGDDMSEEEIIYFLQGEMYIDYDEDEKYSFKSIVSADPLGIDEEYTVKGMYSEVMWYLNYVNEHGGADKVDVDALEDEWEDYDYDEFPVDVKLEEGYYVVFEVTDETTGETSQAATTVFRMENDGWKVYGLDFEGNSEQRKRDTINASTSSLIKAGNTALVELDEENFAVSEIKETIIVSSDDSMNYNVPETFKTDLFKKRTENYFGKMKEMEWFIVIKGGMVVYAAANMLDDAENVGTYPADSIMKKYEEGSYEITEDGEKVGERTLKELYDICVEAIG